MIFYIKFYIYGSYKRSVLFTHVLYFDRIKRTIPFKTSSYSLVEFEVTKVDC